jgi:hypothetical protein
MFDNSHFRVFVIYKQMHVVDFQIKTSVSLYVFKTSHVKKSYFIFFVLMFEYSVIQNYNFVYF